MPAWTQLTVATSVLHYLPSAGPPLDCPLGAGLCGCALAGLCSCLWLVLETPMKVLSAAKFSQLSS